MSRVEKLLGKMRRNPRDWRIEDLVQVAARQCLQVRNDGGSHFIFSAPGVNLHLSIPSRRPIKPIYIERFLALIDRAISAKQELP
ncbi:MAG: type II toxin-antitoxin system HicA family toxin [Thermoanaerobaculia bacterium]|nr:type II toxin-antitoxin system HicA family toxin [Thermoanaerobaculia bacterium]MBP9824329.1 type II toxin-antitoxin system HicA family toxin [Thermoanaerobaculia bacterium]